MLYHLFSNVKRRPNHNAFYWNEILIKEFLLSNYSNSLKQISDQPYFLQFIKKFWHFFILYKKGGVWVKHKNYLKNITLEKDKSYLSSKVSLKDFYTNPAFIKKLGTKLIKIEKEDRLIKRVIEIILKEPEIFINNHFLSEVLISHVVSSEPTKYKYFNYLEFNNLVVLKELMKEIFNLTKVAVIEIKDKLSFSNDFSSYLKPYIKESLSYAESKHLGKKYYFLQHYQSISLGPINKLKLINKKLTTKDVPMISCLMVTFSKKLALAQAALECFKKQTYPNLELVLLEEGGEAVYQWANQQKINNLKYYPIKKHKKLGELRNIALEICGGDYICQWDDDDLSDPHRLEIQYQYLKATNTQGCFLARQTIEYAGKFIKAYTSYRVWENTMLLKKDNAIKYPKLARGEDTKFILDYLFQHKVVLIDLPKLYTYRIHGNNTFPPNYFNSLWQYITEIKQLTL